MVAAVVAVEEIGDDIIIDENKIIEDAIELELNDSTPGTSNTFYFSKTYNYNSYGFGSNTDNVIATVTDMNDNSATASLAINFTKTDTQSPTISSFSANTSSLTWYSSSGSSNKTATFTAVVSDNVGINSISINGGTQTNVSGNTYTFTKSFSRPTLNNSVNNAVTLTVQDAASNSTSNTIYVTTNHVDNTPPVISSFSANNTSISLNTSNLQTQTITFTATITDNLSINNVSYLILHLLAHLEIHTLILNY